MAKLSELDKHKRKQVANQMKNSEALTDAPITVKVIKVKSVFNHLSVARCRLETGEYTVVAFKHEKESVEIDLPQVVEGIRLTLIPPYYSLNVAEQEGTSVVMASMYQQHEHAEDEQDDMLSEEHEDCKHATRITLIAQPINSLHTAPSLAAEKLLTVYSPSTEFQYSPMQIVPLTKPTEHVPSKEDSLRVFVQRVIVQQLTSTCSMTSDEAPRKKSRGRPALSDLCDGFFLHKLKQLQISQYNTDKLTASTGLGVRLITQSSPNTVTVIDVRHTAKWYVEITYEIKLIILARLCCNAKAGGSA